MISMKKRVNPIFLKSTSFISCYKTTVLFSPFLSLCHLMWYSNKKRVQVFKGEERDIWQQKYFKLSNLRGSRVRKKELRIRSTLKRCQLNLQILNLSNLESRNRIVTKKSILYTVLRLSRVYTRRAFGDVAIAKAFKIVTK